MTAVLVLIGIVVVIIAAIVLLAVPVRHAEAVANGFSWHWSVRVGTRVWVGKKSKRKPIGEQWLLPSPLRRCFKEGGFWPPGEMPSRMRRGVEDRERHSGAVSWSQLNTSARKVRKSLVADTHSSDEGDTL